MAKPRVEFAGHSSDGPEWEVVSAGGRPRHRVAGRCGRESAGAAGVWSGILGLPLRNRRGRHVESPAADPDAPGTPGGTTRGRLGGSDRDQPTGGPWALPGEGHGGVVDPIRLSDGDNGFRVRVPGRRKPGVRPLHDLLDAEVLVESGSVTGRVVP
ncbi:DUF5959 family protein [Streptomyces sp. NPDC096012]|uniref:DUF5959 family protein n=1 Tax=Streptomyces sp. NPDC096012 TaxID=3155684 RepID=UPI00336A9431